MVDGIYVDASLTHAAALVSRGLARANQFKFFYSNTRWEPGQLEAEIAEVSRPRTPTAHAGLRARVSRTVCVRATTFLSLC